MKKNLFILMLLPMFCYAQTRSEYLQQHQSCMQKNRNHNNGTVIGCTDHIVQLSQKEIDITRQRIQRKYPNYQKQFNQLHQSWLNYRQKMCYLQGNRIGSPMETFCEMNNNLQYLDNLKMFLD
ncbi:hypothetical protein [Wielerella bovis]|uniref:hypothetical protein n=1 Tax=Wielerella bovis TaxID=2917790 RepID=UPI002018E0BD|nr:hypothetical protein [Wielerella bovis]ULJ59876.1 hypothetical protein MIS44_09395 [Wielerella bovis]